MDTLYADCCEELFNCWYSLFVWFLIFFFQCWEQVKLLFAAEKKICDHILDGVDSLRDQCFAEVTVNSVSVLLSFGEAIAKSKRSPEKLFVLLDMYEIMRELHSEVWKLLLIAAKYYQYSIIM